MLWVPGPAPRRRGLRPLPSLLILSDVFLAGTPLRGSGQGSASHNAHRGWGHAIGLSAVLAAKRLGAERIILMRRHKDGTDCSRDFGATDVVAERGEEASRRVRELTDADGTHTVLEAVGDMPTTAERGQGRPHVKRLRHGWAHWPTD